MAAVPSIGRATQVQPRPAAPEADATRALYERYHRQIFSFCLHQLGNREEAEDAVQGTFLNAFRGLKSGIVPEHESAWVFKIASNVCMTRRRASFRRGRVESASDLQAFQDVIPGPKGPGDELMGLSEALHAMPDQQRTAILLREWQGLSYREIAEDMGLTQGAVETLIFRARRTLATGLEEQQSTSKLSRLRHAGDFGSLLAAAKTFLAGSAAVKVAATVAIATTTVVATETKASSPADRKSGFVQMIQNEAPLVAPAAVTVPGSVAQRPVVGVPPADAKVAAAKRAETKRAVAEVFAALLSSPATSLVTDPEPAAPALLGSPESSPVEPAAAVEAPAAPPPVVAAPSEQPPTHASPAEPKSEAPRAAAPAEQPKAETPRASAPAEQSRAERPKSVVAATERPRAEQPKSETKSESKSESKSETRAESKAESKAEAKAESKSESKGETKSEQPRAEQPKAAEPSSEQPKNETRAESKSEAKNEAKNEGKSDATDGARGDQPKSEAPASVPSTPAQPKADEGKAASTPSDSRTDKAAEKATEKSDRSEKTEKSGPAPTETQTPAAPAATPATPAAPAVPATPVAEVGGGKKDKDNKKGK